MILIQNEPETGLLRHRRRGVVTWVHDDYHGRHANSDTGADQIDTRIVEETAVQRAVPRREIRLDRIGLKTLRLLPPGQEGEGAGESIS